MHDQLVTVASQLRIEVYPREGSGGFAGHGNDLRSSAALTEAMRSALIEAAELHMPMKCRIIHGMNAFSGDAEESGATDRPATVRAYVNERGVSLPLGAVARDAVRAFDVDEFEALARGERTLTDSRGLPVASDMPVHGGAIYRLLPVRHAAPVADSSSPEARP